MIVTEIVTLLRSRVLTGAGFVVDQTGVGVPRHVLASILNHALTDNSPDSRLGSKALRVNARVRDSLQSAKTREMMGSTACSYAWEISGVGTSVSIQRTAVEFNSGMATPIPLRRIVSMMASVDNQ
jgi:hypothetical protein